MKIESIRTIIRIVGAGATILSTAGFASANMTNVYSGHTLTGQNSVATTNVADASSMLKNISNFGTSAALLSAAASTGDFDILHNTTVAGVHTGGVNLGGVNAVQINPMANMVVAGPNPGDTVNVVTSDSKTGQNSSSTTNVNVSNTSTTRLSNIGSSFFTAGLDLSTGGVGLNGNTSIGHVSTGNINGSVNNAVSINSGAASAASTSSSTPLNVSVNSTADTTGQNSVAATNVNATHSDTTTVNNVATGVASYDVNASTGEIDADGNTSIGDISSGDVTIGFTNMFQGN